MQHLDTDTLSSYIDSELPAEEIGQVEMHLASCSQCQREYRELLGVSLLVQALPTYQPRTSAEVRPNKSGPRDDTIVKLSRLLRPLAVAALVIIIAIAGLRLIGELTESGQDEGDPIEFTQGQPDGTDADRSSSQSVAEEEPDAAPDALEDSVDTAMAPAAAVATEVPTETPPEPGEELGSSICGQVRTALYVVMGAAIVGTAIWLLYQRTRR